MGIGHYAIDFHPCMTTRTAVTPSVPVSGVVRDGLPLPDAGDDSPESR